MTVGKLNEALDALEADHDFLLEGGVFTSDVLDALTSAISTRRRSVRSACDRIRMSFCSTTASSWAHQWAGSGHEAASAHAHFLFLRRPGSGVEAPGVSCAVGVHANGVSRIGQ